MADQKKILLISKDSALEKHIKKLSTVITAKQIATATKILEKSNNNFDLIVLGPPFGQKEKEQIEHSNIFVISQPEDVAALFELYKPQHKLPETTRKIRQAKADLDYSTAQGIVLVITTNKTVTKELSCFNLKVATNLYSAQRLLHDNDIKMIVIDTDIKLKTTLPTYRWEVDVSTKKDIYLLLTTGRFSLETATE